MEEFGGSLHGEIKLRMSTYKFLGCVDLVAEYHIKVVVAEYHIKAVRFGRNRQGTTSQVEVLLLKKALSYRSSQYRCSSVTKFGLSQC